MAKINFQQLNEMSSTSSDSSRVKFFSLKNDGDEAVVRIMHDSPETFDIVTNHTVTIDGKYRSVNCIREIGQPVTNCPLCECEIPVKQTIYVHMINYVKDEEGKIVPVPVVWSRAAKSMSQKLMSLIEEYGPLSDCIFKIRRNGKPGDKTTKYEILFGNPSIYHNDLYPKIDDAFKGYEAVGNAVLDKNYEELKEFIETGSFNDSKESSNTNNVTPTINSNYGTVTPPVTNPNSFNTTPPFINNSPINNTTPSGNNITGTTTTVSRPTRYY